MTPRHTLALLLTLPVAWMGVRAWVAWGIYQRGATGPIERRDVEHVYRVLVLGDREANTLIHAEGVYLRALMGAALFTLCGFALGITAGVCL